ncbi:TetR/AcrR family transcriptional regulator [Nocardia terpenica]|uniref:TetR family transcriptional regulator n=1 Tax=Nocardia terpenica TaxID=455432 RepID=A0A6G9YW35_9NOCA|nr:TetR/AcrR family transcriptional regulator [Nocardia terpenica]QIS17216.1 TetR family transcriptional regulator [Nocardia terpenica]
MPDDLRIDARSNREQILAAAQIVFRELGVDVPMKEIADRAGVGVGTLYRRFPDRTALISAVGHSYLSTLAEMAAAARREESDAWLTLCRFLRECAELRLGALASAIEPALHGKIPGDPDLTEVRARVAEEVVAMTAQAQADGHLRADVAAGDVARLMTLQIYVRPGESYAEAVRRIIDIALDGLRAKEFRPQ